MPDDVLPDDAEDGAVLEEEEGEVVPDPLVEEPASDDAPLDDPDVLVAAGSLALLLLRLSVR